jgi:hypothetical protein
MPGSAKSSGYLVEAFSAKGLASLGGGLKVSVSQVRYQALLKDKERGYAVLPLGCIFSHGGHRWKLLGAFGMAAGAPDY